MKNISKGLLLLVTTAITAASCHKIDVPINTELTPETFPQTESQYNSVKGPVYIQLRNDYGTGYFFMQSQTSDESVLPTYGSDWLDGNRYLDLHRHTWNKDHSTVNGEWSYLTNLIGTVNQTIYILNQSPESSAKTTSISEMRTVRAYAYFMMVDIFGNVPLDTVYPSTVLNPTTARAKVFEYAESELKASIPTLPTAAGAGTYGKPTRYMAYSILAKMYLNAEVYTGTQRWNDCIAACDTIMNAGGGSQYGLESRANYLQMFYPTNGPSAKEFIYAIPSDASVTTGNMFYARYDLNRNLGIRYLYSGSTPGSIVNPIMNGSTGGGLINNKPSGPRCTTDEFFALFNDPNDIRNKQWLSGQQYWQDGTPIQVKTTNLGYNQFYAGADPGAAYTYPLVLSPLGVSRNGAASFDLGKDEIAWNTGVRNIKFYPDYTNTISRNQNNDVPVFRYSDIVLTKAEAILRGGTPTAGHTALSLVNLLRAQRSTSLAWTTLSLEDLYGERSRELAWEMWHRNDMIRFGHFEDSYGLAKTNKDVYRRLFPIPTVALTTNPNLTQNPGY